MLVVPVTLADDDLLYTLGLQIPARTRNLPLQRAGSHHLGTGEVCLGVGRAHAPLEVAVAGTDAVLSRLKQSGAEADARATS